MQSLSFQLVWFLEKTRWDTKDLASGKKLLSLKAKKFKKDVSFPCFIEGIIQFFLAIWAFGRKKI